MQIKHWWIKDKKFQRVRMSTLYRLGVLYTAEKIGSHETGSVSDFLLWLEKYINFENN